MSILLFAMSRIVPLLLARLGSRPLTIAGASAQVLGMAWLTQVGTNSAHLTAVGPAMVLFGLAVGLLHTPLASVLLGESRRPIRVRRPA